MLKVYFTVLLLLFSLSIGHANEYIYKEPLLGKNTYKQHLKHLQAPDIHISSHCSGSPITICQNYATNHFGLKIRSFSSGMLVDGKVRYSDKAYIIMQTVPCTAMRCDTYQVLQSNGQMRSFEHKDVITPFVDYQGQFHVISQTGYSVQKASGQTIQKLEFPEPIEQGIFGTGLSNHMAAVAVGKSGSLYLYDRSRIVSLGFQLSAYGDRDKIIAIYPDKKYIYIATYRYTNAYNKGLYIQRYQRSNQHVTGGWLINSEDRNIGFKVSIYKLNNNIIVGTKDASNNQDIHFSLSDKDITQLPKTLPSHLLGSGFEYPSLFSMTAGVLTSLTTLSITSDATYDDNPTLKTSLRIEANDAWLQGINFEGRIGGTPIILQYLQNRAEEVTSSTLSTSGSVIEQRLNQAASHKFFSSIGLDNLLQNIRISLQYTDLALSGIAHITDSEGTPSIHSFTSNLQRSRILFHFEGGTYTGIEYKTFSSPSKIGFSNYLKQTVYTGVDLEANYNIIKAIIGYNHIAYAKRYETDLSEFYWSANINGGLGTVSFSEAFKQDVLSRNLGSTFTLNQVYGEVGFDAELGYIWQQRFRNWKGFGYSIGAGYLMSGSYLRGSRPDKQENLKFGTLYTNHAYSTFIHGPYLRFNIIF